MTPSRCDPPEVMNKLDELFPRVEDFPAHHIGPRKIEAKIMLQELGYNVRSFFIVKRKAISNRTINGKNQTMYVYFSI